MPGRQVKAESVHPAVAPVALVDRAAHHHPPPVGAVIGEYAGHREFPLTLIRAQAQGIPTAQLVVIGIGLGDDHRRRPQQGMADFLPIAAREGVTGETHRRHIDDKQGGRFSRRFQFQVPRPGGNTDSGQLCQPFHYLWFEQRMAAQGAAGGGHVDVGAQIVLQPADDGEAEAADHDADADSGGDGDDQGGGSDAGAAEGSGQIAGGHAPQQAADPADGRLQQAQQEHDSRRGEQGITGNQGKQSGEGQGDAPPGEQKEDAAGQHQRRADRRSQRQKPPVVPFQDRAGEDGTGRGHRRLPGGDQGRRQRSADPQGDPLAEQQGGDCQVAHRQDEIEIVDGAGDQVQQTAPQSEPEQQSESGAGRPQQGGLAKNQGENFPPRHPQGAQGSQQLPSLQDGKREGVVDEEHPDHQGQQAQGGQVELESPRHAGEKVAAAAGGKNSGGRRQDRAHPRQQGLPFPSCGNQQVDTGEFAAASRKTPGRWRCR